MGMAMGQDCELLSEVCGWINAAATKPVWAKMTPNITDITKPAACALAAGCEGVAAINTLQVCEWNEARIDSPPQIKIPFLEISFQGCHTSQFSHFPTYVYSIVCSVSWVWIWTPSDPSLL